MNIADADDLTTMGLAFWTKRVLKPAAKYVHVSEQPVEDMHGSADHPQVADHSSSGI